MSDLQTAQTSLLSLDESFADKRSISSTLVNLAKTGDLKLDKLITKKFKLEEINDVAKAMEKREIQGRWVCEID